MFKKVLLLFTVVLISMSAQAENSFAKYADEFYGDQVTVNEANMTENIACEDSTLLLQENLWMAEVPDAPDVIVSNNKKITLEDAKTNLDETILAKKTDSLANIHN